MRVKLFAYLVMLGAAAPLTMSGQFVTHNPEVEEASVSDVEITKVEITGEYTAIFLRYTEEGSGAAVVPEAIPPQFRGFYRPRNEGPQIWLDPNTRLYKPGDVNTKFKFLRAEGIPLNPERKQVGRGEVVEFVAYFEKVTPGIEIIDFYEGKRGPNTITWNFYGVHINNPAPGKEPAFPDKAVVSPEEKPAKEGGETGTFPGGFSALSGSVLNARTGEPVGATITYVDNNDTVSVTTRSGKFKIGLDSGRRYVFRASAPGFGEETWELDSSIDTLSSTFFEHDFRLTPLSEGTTFILDNIYFETSSYTLLAESFAELDRFVKIMRDNPNLFIRVEGHTDNVGDFEKNVTLSLNRAEAVKRYLVEKGTTPDRIETKGYGPTRPEAKGSSEEERRKNRRVEIVILKS